MIVKALEIRDRMTFIPVVAMDTAPANEGQRYLLRRSGYAPDGSTVIVMMLSKPDHASYDPYRWPGHPDVRTMPEAHLYIQEHFHELKDGDVVDVEYILNETAAPKQSERFTFPI